MIKLKDILSEIKVDGVTVKPDQITKAAKIVMPEYKGKFDLSMAKDEKDLGLMLTSFITAVTEAAGNQSTDPDEREQDIARTIETLSVIFTKSLKSATAKIHDEDAVQYDDTASDIKQKKIVAKDRNLPAYKEDGEEIAPHKLKPAAAGPTKGGVFK